MESRNQDRFAVTHWPGEPVPVPEVTVWPMWRLADDILLFAQHSVEAGALDRDSTELPPELYLREFTRIAPDDTEALVEFCHRYGAVGADGLTDLPWVVADLSRDCPGVSLPRPWDEVQSLVGRHSFLHKDAGEVDQRLSALSVALPVPDVAAVIRVQTLGSVVLHHAVLSDLTSLWQFLGGGITLDELDANWRTPKATTWQMPRSAWGSYEDTGTYDGAEVRYTVPASDPYEAAAHRLTWGIGAALTPFHVRLDVRSRLPDGSWMPDMPWTPFANVYELMCLQLANHIAEGAHYKECDADDCKNLFVRTEGYSVAGQNRLRGNRFCSVRCADRYRQQRYRRRKREQPTPGPSRKSGQD